MAGKIISGKTAASIDCKIKRKYSNQKQGETINYFRFSNSSAVKEFCRPFSLALIVFISSSVIFSALLFQELRIKLNSCAI
jgi:hypothetical protein